MSTENATSNTAQASAESTSSASTGSQTAAVETQGTSSGSNAGVTQAAQPETQTPAYTPNFKFKVYDEEKEIEEIYRGLIKDADTEKKIRELHEKAYGLDFVKPKHEKLKNEFSQVNEKYTTLDKSLKTLSGFLQSGDLGAFLDGVNIPKEMVFDWVKKELELMSADPAKKAEMEEFNRIKRERFALQQQNEELSQRFSQEALQTRAFELNSQLAKPEVSKVAAWVDAKLGKGAFYNAVCERGILAEKQTGAEIPVEQAVAETLAYWSKLYQEQGVQSATQESVPQISAQASKPTLPNVSGKSTSPLKGGPKSLDDLKKIAQQMAT